MLRALGAASLAGLAFLATTAAIRSQVPLPDAFGLAARTEHVAARAGPLAQLVVIGPSTTRCGFDPRVFDAELARLGHEVWSFNLAVPGARSFEIDHLLGLLIERPPAGLRWVAIELQPARPTRLMRPPNRFTDKEVYWHTGRQLGGVLRALAGSDEPPALQGGAALLHGQHALWRLVSLGQGIRIAGAKLAPGAVFDDERRGFAPEDCRSGPRAERARLDYLADPAEIRRRERALDRQNARAVGVGHLDPVGLGRQVARLRGAGIEPVYFLSPILSPSPAIHALHRDGVLPTLLAFDSPRRHPELYRAEHRLDDLHLNADGAAAFTRVFARRFARGLEATPAP